MAKDADKKVLDLRKSLLKKKSALLDAENPTYKTSGLFRPEHNSNRFEINIKAAVEKDIVNAQKSLILTDLAMEKLGLTSGTHLGYSTAEWNADFKTRIAVLNRTKNLHQRSCATDCSHLNCAPYRMVPNCIRRNEDASQKHEKRFCAFYAQRGKGFGGHP